MSHPIKLENMCPVGRGQGSHARPDELILVLPVPHCTDVGEVADPGVPEVADPGVPEVADPGVPEVVHSEPKSGHATPDKYTPRTIAKITKQNTTTISIMTLVFINILKYLNCEI